MQHVPLLLNVRTHIALAIYFVASWVLALSVKVTPQDHPWHTLASSAKAEFKPLTKKMLRPQ